MRFAHHLQIRRRGVVAHLLNALAPGNHARDRRMLQTPRQRPLRHRHIRRHFLLGDLLNLAKLRVILLVSTISHRVSESDSNSSVSQANALRAYRFQQEAEHILKELKRNTHP